jgi:esterase/lipase superfamily enzyme
MKTQADNVTLYASSRDLALKISDVWAGYNRAGEGGDRIVVVPGIVTIDASAAETSRLGFLHQYYADSRTVMSDVYQLMQGTPPSKRFGLRLSAKNGHEFWRFVP